MDWIRLTKSGKDLTGLKGRLIEVTEEELAKHNKTDDCWICIRGESFVGCLYTFFCLHQLFLSKLGKSVVRILFTSLNLCHLWQKWP